ncbi:lanthionine synthetase C family protein [Streptomyces sp. NPDC001404]|uniref:lanthionine synthetase C family protein n=1 Tax=Streptomyces sp. NPDC001404 TaxID=3364571 RepID=UPI0036C02E36
MGDRQWTPAVSGKSAEAALRLVAALAGPPRATPARVRPDLAGGGAGLALAYHQLDTYRPGEGWGAMADGYLTAAAAGAASTGTTGPGLYGGLSGPAFAACSLTDRHQDLLTDLDARIAAAATGQAARCTGGVHGVPYRIFDVISGLTGTGAHLLGRAGDDPAAAGALRAVLTALVTLSGERAGVPHWFTPVEALRDDEQRSRFPRGALNCGLSHGMAGPLALLSLAMADGMRVPGQEEAVRRVVDRLLMQRIDDAWGPDWPDLAGVTGILNSTPAPHSSWCYGSPGVARSVWLAGTALDDPALQALAVRAVKAALRRPAARRAAGTTPGLCHGLAGLLQITLRFAHDTGDPEFARAAVELTVQLSQCADRGGGFAQDGPGFLEGAAGVVLALLAATTRNAPTWDRVLLLA